MNFDKFLNASLTAREATIPVPELKDFFGDDEPVWKVRGLTSAELARSNEAGEAGDNLNQIVDALANGHKAEAIKKLAGVPSKDTPQDVSRRIQMIVMGSVSPSIDDESRDVVVRLAETFPTVFYKLSNKIINLTGEGAKMGKRKPSGKAQKSGD